MKYPYGEALDSGICWSYTLHMRKQHIIIVRSEHKRFQGRRSIVRSEHKPFQGRRSAMAGANDANGQLFQFLNQLLNKVEAETNQPETELRSKIKALELETTKVPSISSKQPDELEIAKELDRMSAKLESIDELLSSSSPADLQVQGLLSGTVDLWMPVITATTEERQAFAAAVAAEEQDTSRNKN